MSSGSQLCCWMNVVGGCSLPVEPLVVCAQSVRRALIVAGRCEWVADWACVGSAVCGLTRD